jgi:hypothetical protein
VGRVQTLPNFSFKATIEARMLISNTHSAAVAASPLLQVCKIIAVLVHFD